ncbi:hydroxymethylpyrimidine/phosphomethylpyrimidine kinase [Duganella sp. FT135W]|uniref:hydroxymethylpyrimidine kinase n=1 Tax=Duganella flavida TaxID=2692175 RepID=A0A6L8K2C2_9BURK|nr:hydroxymethylpyrimidine/phosphomethylpyrimidine kinase [Duganella flavida]MYM21623.1 hydroxymethylpyrimidine/phosphomethylpyrimidine kinase [Duganella flavida]
MTADARPCVLVFAGLDPSGGAGLSADLQAVAGQGAHALTVCTALTVQDNDRVYGVQPVDAGMVLRQAQALINKCVISAIKIGITGSAANALAMAEVIVRLRERQPELPVVLDPVLASGHGDLLSRDDAVQALAPLLSLATVITPNGPEARALSDATQPDAQAQALRARGCRHILITGGHSDGDEVVNRWYGPGPHAPSAAAMITGSAYHERPREWRWTRLAGEFHGSGCTLASAIAGQLALGVPTAVALENAQHYTYLALRDAYAIAEGQRIPLR